MSASKSTSLTSVMILAVSGAGGRRCGLGERKKGNVAGYGLCARSVVFLCLREALQSSAALPH